MRQKSKGMEVYLNGKRVQDVTQEPIFIGPLQSIAEQYDLQHDKRYRDILTYDSPTSGEKVPTSFMIPRSKEDLIKKRQAFKLRTDHSFGFMGRAPDFMNSLVTGWAISKEIFSTRGAKFGENAQNYYEYCRENDLFLTHVLITPQIDRSKPSSEQEDPYIHLGRVRETKDGIIVRGAKMVGTFAPLTEEIYVLPFGGVAPGDHLYATVFAIPTDTPGLKFICRETVSPVPRTRYDHPLSSRFEEMDALAVFEDVLVPWDRILVDGSPGSDELINHTLRAYAGSAAVQIASRMLSQMEFLTGVAMRVADAVGIDGFLHVQEKLGEMISYLEVGKSVYYGSEAMAFADENGIWQPGGLGLRSFHLQSMKIYRRMVEIIQILAGGGFFSVPTEADMANPEIRPMIDKYLRGKPGISADEKVRLFKLAWDVTGEAFAQRMQQYVHYFSGDPIRLTAATYLAYDKTSLYSMVDRAMLGDSQTDIPISPLNPGIPANLSPNPNPLLRHTYPESAPSKQSQ